ncbi:MAG: hypothetical protein JW768_12775 [Chitinispirillaceae bacterium]|nr:hypothetical protein [Chitinispirillaceae bacterium]
MNTKSKKMRSTMRGSFFCCAGLLLLASGCDLLYTPKQQPDPLDIDTPPDTGAIGSGYLYQTNINQQTCNPSITQSEQYKGCLLWLGFTTLSVRIPTDVTGYDTVSISQHDRLTVTDSANTVRWFIMREQVDTRGELQDPEWSTHPDYLSCLVGIKTQPFSACAIRMSDKAVLKITDTTLSEFSTPHFWLPDSALSGGTVAGAQYDSNGFVMREYVEQFFGTTQLKFVYVLPKRSGTLFYVDYSLEQGPVPIPLTKPVSREAWECESPLISPDGNWVAYHCYQRGSSTRGEGYSSYIQRLKPGSIPVLIADKASDPHWWVDPTTNVYYIVYTVTVGDYFSQYDYTNPLIEANGVAGATMKQRLRGSWVDGPSHMGGLEVDTDVQPYILVRLPFKGGLSRDGWYLGTAYKFAYLMRLK